MREREWVNDAGDLRQWDVESGKVEKRKGNEGREKGGEKGSKINIKINFGGILRSLREEMTSI